MLNLNSFRLSKTRGLFKSLDTLQTATEKKILHLRRAHMWPRLLVEQQMCVPTVKEEELRWRENLSAGVFEKLSKSVLLHSPLWEQMAFSSQRTHRVHGLWLKTCVMSLWSFWSSACFHTCARPRKRCCCGSGWKGMRRQEFFLFSWTHVLFFYCDDVTEVLFRKWRTQQRKES